MDRARIDAALLEPCAGPSVKPESATDSEVGRLWQRDRSALRECKARHGGLAAAVTIIEARGEE